MPFDDDNIPEQKKKIGMKLKNPPSVKFDPKQEFRNQVKEIDKNQDINNLFQTKIAELTSQYFKILEDKTLTENKSPPSKEAEKELIDNLVKVSMEINNFEINQFMENENPLPFYGMGSSALINLLLNCLYFERNKLNRLEYTLVSNNKKITMLENTLNSYFEKITELEEKLDKVHNDT